MTQPVPFLSAVLLPPPGSQPFARQYSGLGEEPVVGEGFGGRSVSASPSGSGARPELPAVFTARVPAAPLSPPRALRDPMTFRSGDKRERGLDDDEQPQAVAVLDLTTERGSLGRVSPRDGVGFFEPDVRRMRPRIAPPDATPGTALALAFGDMPSASVATEATAIAPPRSVTVAPRVPSGSGIFSALVFSPSSSDPLSQLGRVAALASSLGSLPPPASLQAPSVPSLPQPLDSLTLSSVAPLDSAEGSQPPLEGSMATTVTIVVRSPEVVEFSVSSPQTLEEGEVPESSAPHSASGLTNKVSSHPEV